MNLAGSFVSLLPSGITSFHGSLHKPLSPNHVRHIGNQCKLSAFCSNVGIRLCTISRKISHASSCCAPLSVKPYPPCCASDSLVTYSEDSKPLDSMPMSCRTSALPPYF